MSKLQTEAPRASAGLSPQAITSSAYRPEVQGLRALAVLMVVTYHIWFGRVSGGVDVFLLISAFLLSLSFIRKVESGRPLELGRYWLHRFKRLLPPVAVVLIGTLAATALFVPQTRWTEILSQTWSSLLYFQNWALAAESVDYYAADHSTASPLQHFWSLSVQGQVFILWPLMFAAAALLARILRVRYRFVVLGIFGGLFAASLWFSVAETYGNQAHAYFDTRTRLWEFALGTLLALALPYLKPLRWMRVAMGWLGLAVMLSVGFILDVQGQFPGYVALAPLLAAALVIVAGQSGSRFGVDRLLSCKPLIGLGDMSYALYLWHWPVLVVYLVWRGREEVGPLGGTLIILLSLVLARLTSRLVERPLQSAVWANRTTGRSALVMCVCLAAVAVPVGSWQVGLKVQADRLAGNLGDYLGARVLMADYEDVNTADTAPIPRPSMMQAEWGTLPFSCGEMTDGPADPVLTDRCMTTAPLPEAERTILVLGDSHTEQWLGALEPMARDHHYRLVALLLGGCSFGDSPDTQWPECADFNRAVLEYALDLKPDAVLTVATAAEPADALDRPVAGLPEASEQLMNHGIPVVGIRDNPRYDFDMVACAEANGVDSPDCIRDVEEKLSDPGLIASFFDTLPGVSLMDMTDLICPGGKCRAVVGNVHIYMDNNHLTTTYTASMLDEFDRRFHEVLNW